MSEVYVMFLISDMISSIDDLATTEIGNSKDISSISNVCTGVMYVYECKYRRMARTYKGTTDHIQIYILMIVYTMRICAGNRIYKSMNMRGTAHL